MDWRMPGLDGVETTRRIRGVEALEKIPIIIMVTAYGSEEVRDSAAQAGLDGFLVKPVTASTLQDAIQTACR
jgi:two-component system, sensor histidine kinase and response regulator